jgi:hypothetical protein
MMIREKRVTMKTNDRPEAAASSSKFGRPGPGLGWGRRLAHPGLLAPLALGAALVAPPSHAQGYAERAGRVGLVAEVDAEFGGDGVAVIYYTNGTNSTIRAGQGLNLAIGAHYRPVGLPIDFAATAGYKFVGTEDRDSNIGLYRVVLKFTGTYQLPNRFWVDLGPVFNTGTKLRAYGYAPDIPFDDSVGVTAGFGWRWVGVSYTSMKYKSSQLASDVDASNIGINLVYKF